MFTLDTFVQTIDVLRKQHEIDVAYATSIEKAINAKDVPAYDNSLLINHLFGLLQRQFPAIDGECEIERFCYVLNYGFSGGKQVLTAEDLWESLHRRKPLPIDINASE